MKRGDADNVVFGDVYSFNVRDVFKADSIAGS